MGIKVFEFLRRAPGTSRDEFHDYWRDVHGPTLANDPDLRAFQQNGGKLLMYHGWMDTGITPRNSTQYYESVVQEMGGAPDDWMKLYMVPGMGHCSGGPGPYEFELLTVLEKWRERGRAPDAIPARNPDSGLTRPLCPSAAARSIRRATGIVRRCRNRKRAGNLGYTPESLASPA